MNVAIRVVGVTFALATLLHSQEPAPADPLIRLSVNLVQIDAVVTDSSGKHVTDLKASDFEILEDHKRQRITTFSFIPGRRPPGSSSTPDAVVREAVAGVSGTLALPRREDVQRAMVLIVDDFSLSAQSMPYIRKAIAQFIDDRLLPGDLVSLMSASGGTGSLQRFTEDKHQLHAALDRVRWLPGNGLSPFQPIRMGDSASIGASGGLQTQQSRAEAHVRTYFSQGTAGAVRYAIQGLRQMPGRKALVLITEGFRYDSFWENVIEQANRAGVTIYMSMLAALSRSSCRHRTT
jgi:VWFA-related protein